MVELQIINKILKTKDLSILNDNQLDKSYFSLTATKMPKDIIDTIPGSFTICESNPFALRSVYGVKRNQGSISSLDLYCKQKGRRCLLG